MFRFISVYSVSFKIALIRTVSYQTIPLHIFGLNYLHGSKQYFILFYQQALGMIYDAPADKMFIALVSLGSLAKDDPFCKHESVEMQGSELAKQVKYCSS
jgi:hypothetical protein